MAKTTNTKNSLADGVELIFNTKSPKHHFFGYYDKSPLDANGRLLLCHSVDFDLRMPGPKDTAEIGYWHILTGKYQKIAESRSFNFQQGAMLQWMPPDFSNKVIYNDFIDGDYRAVIVYIESGKKTILSNSIYALSPCGKYALTPVFKRLFFPRSGYSYSNIKDDTWNENIPQNDGIVLLDIEKNTHRRIITTKQMFETNHHETMNQGNNYLEHIMFNPDGSRFAFLHRWLLDDGAFRTRLYTADLDGKNLHCFPDSGFYSHGCWRSNSQLLFWSRRPGIVSRFRNSRGSLKLLLKPLLKINRMLPGKKNINRLRSAVSAMSFNILDDKTSTIQPIDYKKLPEDGHCSFRPNDDSWLLSDTYPDNNGLQRILLYKLQHKYVITLAKLNSPLSHLCEKYRCDLHPRWSHCGNKICVDSLQDQTRQMYIYDVTDIIKKFDAGS